MVAGGEDSRLAKREVAPVKDPIGAFKRWADEFMAGTEDELEGLRLAKARRDEMARLIREAGQGHQPGESRYARSIAGEHPRGIGATGAWQRQV